MLISSSRLRAQSIDSAHRAKRFASGGDYHADTPRFSEAVGVGTWYGHGIARNQGGKTGGVGGRAENEERLICRQWSRREKSKLQTHFAIVSIPPVLPAMVVVFLILWYASIPQFARWGLLTLEQKSKCVRCNKTTMQRYTTGEFYAS